MAAYEPPPDQKPPSGYTQSTGPRGGCEVTGDTSLTTLAPHKHIGQTAYKRPTFAWFVPDSKPYPLEFTLYKNDPVSGPKLAYKTKLKSSPGIMKLSLPKNSPGLALDQRYIWQVAMLCNPNHPSSDLVAKAEIEVVKMPPTLALALPGVSDRIGLVDLLAKAGLWYDALGEALEARNFGLKKVAATLLEDLARLEDPEATQSMNLRQIARRSGNYNQLPMRMNPAQ